MNTQVSQPDIQTTVHCRILPADPLVDADRDMQRREMALIDKGENPRLRRTFATEIKQINVEAREVRHVISNDAIDRVGDMIDPMGWDLRWFRKNPVVLQNHSYAIEDLIGTAKDVEATPEGLFSTTVFDDEIPAGKLAWTLVQKRLARTWSVGFRPIKAHSVAKGASELECEKCIEAAKKQKGREWIRGIHFEKAELLEYSLVAVPMNQTIVMGLKADGFPVSVISKFMEPESLVERLLADPDPVALGAPADERLRALIDERLKAYVGEQIDSAAAVAGGATRVAAKEVARASDAVRDAVRPASGAFHDRLRAAIATAIDTEVDCAIEERHAEAESKAEKAAGLAIDSAKLAAEVTADVLRTLRSDAAFEADLTSEVSKIVADQAAKAPDTTERLATIRGAVNRAGAVETRQAVGKAERELEPAADSRAPSGATAGTARPALVGGVASVLNRVQRRIAAQSIRAQATQIGRR